MYALVLVLIVTSPDGVYGAEHVFKGLFKDMATCFEHREQLLIEGEHYEGHFPIRSQAVCIETD